MDVFCFVYNKASSLEDIVKRVVSWIEIRKASAVCLTPPEIVIIIAREDVKQTQVSSEFDVLFKLFSPDSVTSFFAGVRFAKIRKDDLLSSKGHDKLRRQVLRAAARTRRKKSDRGLLFSATHLMAFSQIAFNHLTLTEPFDFIPASRLQNPVAADLAGHLTNFVDQIESAQDLTSFAAEVIASSFLLDHYPPGMHGKSVASAWICTILTDFQPLNHTMSSVRSIATLARMFLD